MKKWTFLLLSGILSLVAAGCRTEGGTPVYDVVVVGGGPAGIGAALAAAETGARTALLERDSRVGGTTVQAEVCDMGLFYAWRHPIITGPGWEMVQRAVAEAGGTLPDFSRQEPDKWMESCVRVDPAVYARVAEETLRQAGAERVREPDDTRQPGSFFFWIDSQGLEFDADEVNRNFKEAVEKGEMLPTDVHVGMSWFIRKGGGSGCYVPLADNSTPEARAATNRRGIEARDRVLAFIHRQKGLENVRLISSASEVGVRETYRVVGEKTITEKDYLEGLVPEDALSWSYWMVDEHNAGTSGARLVFHQPERVGTVPLGAMLPKGVGHMLVAGRAVSSDHSANSALRVQASCMGMGQAAGVTAALAARRRRDPRDVPIDLIKKRLTAIGHLVPQQDSLPSAKGK